MSTLTVKRVLVIEDDPSVQPALVRACRRAFPGCEVVATDRAETAIELLADPNWDIVLSDHNLAGALRGDDVFAFVRANAPALVNRFIFCTSEEAIARAQHSRVLVKPFPLTALMAEFLDIAATSVA